MNSRCSTDTVCLTDREDHSYRSQHNLSYTETHGQLSGNKQHQKKHQKPLPVSDESIDLLCLYHNRAGFEYVETIEPTLAYSIPISILNELYETNIEIANWGRVIHQECLLSLQCIRIDNLTMTAKERYEALLSTFPDICQRVNLGYIASFLGISISTLSRIRAGK